MLDEKNEVLSEQLSGPEGAIPKVREQVSPLEKKLDAVEKKENILEPSELAGSKEAKPKLHDQVSQTKKRRDTVEKNEDILEPYKLIEKLQAEVKKSQEQLKATKVKYRLMKKRHSESLTEKQEAALKILELNQKIDSLSAKLAPRAECSFNDLPPVDEVDRKYSLILELSAKVSAQTERIIQLEAVLKEKEKKIQKLEAKLKFQTFQMLEPITFQKREALTFQEPVPLTYEELEPPTIQESEKLLEDTESPDSVSDNVTPFVSDETM